MDDSKRRGRPVPDAINIKHVIFKLEETLSIENLNRPNLLLFENEQKTSDEVKLYDRDCSINSLKFLRIWFDLPHNVFFTSAAYLDLFLAKMKVKGKYLKCLTVSCFYLAAKKNNFNINTSQLINISQSKCSVKDMHRMSDIVLNKLNLKDHETNITTSYDFMKIYFDILEYLSDQWNDDTIFKKTILQKENLLNRLITIISDSSCAFYKPSVLSFALIKNEFDKFMAQTKKENILNRLKDIYNFLTVLAQLQLTCEVCTVCYTYLLFY